MNDNELIDILKVSKRNNIAANVTGMLIYSDGVFMQVIEGADDEVRKIFQKIQVDARHNNIIKLTEGSLAERNFADWSMMFPSAKAEDLENLGGYINPSNQYFMQTDNQHAAIIMLKTFAENNRII